MHVLLDVNLSGVARMLSAYIISRYHNYHISTILIGWLITLVYLLLSNWIFQGKSLVMLTRHVSTLVLVIEALE